MTKRRMLAMIMALIVVCSMLSACTSEEGSTDDLVNDSYEGLVLVEKNTIEHSSWHYYIVYDKQTQVMYLFMASGANRGGLTVMYNADGTPKLYSPDTETE